MREGTMDNNKQVSPCMGGWCPRRTSCSHYLTPSQTTEPSERLCKRGGPDLYAPLGAPARREGVPA